MLHDFLYTYFDENLVMSLPLSIKFNRSCHFELNFHIMDKAKNDSYACSMLQRNLVINFHFLYK